MLEIPINRRFSVHKKVKGVPPPPAKADLVSAERHARFMARFH